MASGPSRPTVPDLATTRTAGKQEYEIRWWSNSSITETLTGEYEAYITASGSIGYRLIAEASATAGASGSVRGSVTISTVTATSQTWLTGVVATSQGSVLNTCQ